MSSTFKNRIPKRKYRERVQPAEREGLGFLQKKKDYKERAKNFHKKEDMINKLKLKASTKNEDEFYFKMLKGKKTEDGRHVEDSDSEIDEKELRAALKTENYSLVSVQRSIIQKVNTASIVENIEAKSCSSNGFLGQASKAFTLHRKPRKI